MATISIAEFIRQNMTIKEWTNLYISEKITYDNHLIEILNMLKNEKFKHLKAKTKIDLKLGLLSENQIRELRKILMSAFINNASIGEVERAIKQKLKLKDRFVIKDDGEKVLALSAKDRPRAIARTEISRVANESALNNFKKNDIEKVEYLAVLDDRTDEECASLNGKIFTVEEARGFLPRHVNCRCTFIPVIEK